MSPSPTAVRCPATMRTYTIKRGDQVSKLAKTFNTTVRALVQANPQTLQNLDRIEVGTVLCLPT